jgi:hypothetical protein
MLSACRLSSKGCLQMCVESLLDNLKKYPMVNLYIYMCVCIRALFTKRFHLQNAFDLKNCRIPKSKSFLLRNCVPCL